MGRNGIVSVYLSMGVLDMLDELQLVDLSW